MRAPSSRSIWCGIRCPVPMWPATGSIAAQPKEESPGSPSCLIPTLKVGTYYYYRVTAYSVGGQESDRSATVSAAPLPQVSLLLPFNGSAGIQSNPFLQWNAVFIAKSYTVEIYDAFPEFGDNPIWISQPVTAGTGTFYNGVPLAGGQTFYWATGAHDNVDPFQATATSVSEIWHFTVKQ